MRYLFVFITLFMSFNSIAQSKKEQIAILTNRLDSVQQKFDLNISLLSKKVKNLNLENIALNEELEKAQNQLQVESEIIIEKEKSIRTLNQQNLALIKESERIKNAIKDIKLMQSKLLILDSEVNSMNRYELSETNAYYQEEFNDLGPIDTIRLAATMEPLTGTIHYTHKGQKRLEYQIKNGHKHGDIKTWHYNGMLAYQAKYIEGKSIGLFQDYWPNGQLRSTGIYSEHGCPIDTVKGWWEDGALSEIEIYSNCRRLIWNSWHRNGNKSRECIFIPEEGDMKDENGLFKQYFKNGQLRYEVKVEGNKEIYNKEWDLEDYNVVEFPDVEAQFPGGRTAMMKWINDNINYPQKSIEKNEQGRVFLSFIVERNGAISNVAIERGISPDLDKEAKRIISIMPKWTAGEASGRKVRARGRLPINFQLH